MTRIFLIALFIFVVGFLGFGYYLLTNTSDFPITRIVLDDASAEKNASRKVDPAKPAVDWEELRVDPGDWVWSAVDGKSQAEFGESRFRLECDKQNGTIIVARESRSPGQGTLSINTDSQIGSYEGRQVDGFMTATLDANDSILDAMALSRGKFGIDALGAKPILVPSWPEITKVIEDCRT